MTLLKRYIQAMLLMKKLKIEVLGGAINLAMITYPKASYYE